MVKVILLNGPRGVGKDTAASAFVDLADSARILPIMHFAKIAAIAEYGFASTFVHYFETVKDTPRQGLRNKTPRQVYIEYGTRMRAEHGDGYFGAAWAKEARRYRGHGWLVVPDVRFQPEVHAAADTFGVHNVLLARMHRDGHDWTGDIGSYCNHVFAADLYNDVAQIGDLGMRLHTLAGTAL